MTEAFEQKIQPFFWVENGDEASACLNVGEYLQEVFAARADEGFEGSGYDWESLAQVFLRESCPELLDRIHFDPEACMFCAYSADKPALADFILRFKAACADAPRMRDLFSRAKLG